MIMYGVYNADTSEKLIQMIHKMNTRSVWFERLYAGHVNKWFEVYSSSQGANYDAIHSLLCLRPIQKNILKCMKCDTHEIQGRSREFHWFELYRSLQPTHYLLWVTMSMVYPWESVGVRFVTNLYGI